MSLYFINACKCLSANKHKDYYLLPGEGKDVNRHERKEVLILEFFQNPAEIRTRDLLITSQTLLPLSSDGSRV